MTWRKIFLPLVLASGLGACYILLLVPSQTLAVRPERPLVGETGNVYVPEVGNRPKTTARKRDVLSRNLDRRIILKLGQRRVYVYEGDKVLASFRVAVGKKGWETPTGNFQVIKKLRNPAWKNPWKGNINPPGPDSVLGERWIGFWTDGRQTIGFHGTPGEHLLGQAVSHGCVRMRNEDIKAMFDMVEIGTPVIVQP
ncbi:MAG: L,D-transpeptidase [Deltaproteobacteria bacterium]|nr:L,D-transpeptidase [Deltaproteobacteria bacterium]